jgi:hypothetical protein
MLSISTRLTGKTYSGTSCGQTTSVGSIYDQGTNGKGKRTGMSDATSSVAWVFDERGCTILETCTVTGVGSFLTQWTYNSADLQTWVVYPGDNRGGVGEQVYSTYNDQMALTSIVSRNLRKRPVSNLRPMLKQS